MLIDFNLQDGPLLMFAVAVVIVAAIFMFLALVFAVAEAGACFFERRLIAPTVFSWHVASGIVFLVNLSLAAAFPGLIRLFDKKGTEEFINVIVDAPFYAGIPIGLIGMILLALLFVRRFERLISRVFWRLIFSAVSAVTLAYGLNGVLRFLRSFDVFGIVRITLRILETDLGFYIVNGLLIVALFILNFKRISRHSKFVTAINTRV